MSLWGLLFQFHGLLTSWLLNFIEQRHVLAVSTVSTLNFIHIKLFTVSIISKPVYLMTAQGAHKEYNSLTDKIRTKYEQLDSGVLGSPGTPAFDAEACEFAHLLARVSELCIKLNLPTPKEGSLLGCGGCSFVPIDM